jgi:hypothetical protein
MGMTYEANTFYASIEEDFKRLDGTSSYYTMLMGDGRVTMELNFRRVGGEESKENAKKLVEASLIQGVPELATFNIIDTDSGWKYERFVKTKDDDSGYFEIVEEGEHTDHEVYDVLVFFIREELDTYSKLK